MSKFLRTRFYRKPLMAAFFQFDKVTVQDWASADLLFLIKKTVWVSTKKVCRSVQGTLYY